MRLTPIMLTLVVCYKYTRFEMSCFCYPFALVPTAKYDINQILIFCFHASLLF